jgi:nucleoside 2-deoxyribosyltransferase
VKVYLAGPEVFLRDAAAVIARKRALAVEHGFEPVGTEGIEVWPADPFERGVAIFRANEALMREADAMIANVTPFRGISADVGTVWEMGFMWGLGRPVLAYTDDLRDYGERAFAEWYGTPGRSDDEGVLRAPDGQMVEMNAMTDNLMIDGSLAVRGARVIRGGKAAPEDSLDGYVRCLQRARTSLAS